MKRLSELFKLSFVFCLLGISINADAADLDCVQAKKLFNEKKHSQIDSLAQGNALADACTKNVYALSKIELGQRKEGLKLLAELSRKEYAPATVNMAIELELAEETNSSNILTLYQQAMTQSLVNPISIAAFNLSWDHGYSLIKKCKTSHSEFCKSLSGNPEKINTFITYSEAALEVSRGQAAKSLADRQDVESAIIAVFTLGTSLMIKNLQSGSATIRSSSVTSTSATTNSATMGMDQKTYLCVLGHISSGATRSVCP